MSNKTNLDLSQEETSFKRLLQQAEEAHCNGKNVPTLRSARVPHVRLDRALPLWGGVNKTGQQVWGSGWRDWTADQGKTFPEVCRFSAGATEEACGG